MALKYQLQNKIAQSEITKARGNFDPILGGKLGEKNIDGVQYYRQKNIELGIPTGTELILQQDINIWMVKKTQLQ